MRHVRYPAAVVLVAVLASIGLTGCFTGKRPTLAPVAAEITDPAVLAVISRLESANDTQFTATYRILTKLGSEVIPPTDAAVAQTGAAAVATTIATTRFLDQLNGQQTCDLVSGTCESGLNDAAVSNLLVTHDFAKDSPAARLRQDATSMVSAGIASTRDVAGQLATCVQVMFAAGSKMYCALDNGLLAFQDTPDLQIDLVSLTPGADPAMFTTATAVPPVTEAMVTEAIVTATT